MKIMDDGLKRVVITGLGAVCPLGGDLDSIWGAIKRYELGYSHYDHINPNVKAKFFGRINGSIDVSNFPKRITKVLPRFARLGLLSSHEALDMANSDEATPFSEYYSPFDCGVILGTGWGGQDSAINNHDQYSDSGFASPFANLQCMPSVASGFVSIHWNLRGYQSTPAAACATGSIAIGDAYEIIRTGRAKMMLAGGSESVIDPYNIWTIDTLGALTKENTDILHACCPFSAKRSGFVLTEGSAMVCLESLESALDRKATVLAEITGYGSFSDAADITAPAPDGLGRAKSIEYAMEQANIVAKDIDYINAHGTSTPLNDKNETEVLKRVLGKSAYDIPISSTKSYTGHLISAAGAIETAFCVKAIKERLIPATTNYLEPDPELDLDYVPNTHRENSQLDTVMNLNYGFGGCNSALVMRGYHG